MVILFGLRKADWLPGSSALGWTLISLSTTWQFRVMSMYTVLIVHTIWRHGSCKSCTLWNWVRSFCLKGWWSSSRRYSPGTVVIHGNVPSLEKSLVVEWMVTGWMQTLAPWMLPDGVSSLPPPAFVHPALPWSLLQTYWLKKGLEP